MKLKTIANAFEEKVNEDKYGFAVWSGTPGAVQRGAASCGVFPDRYGT